MKIFTLIISVFYSSISFCQDKGQLKKEIENQFKESTEKYSLNDSWLICNKDSAYYRADTLKLYNHINYYYDPINCCEFVNWNFENKSRFRLRETKICNEPPTSKVDIYNLYHLKWDTKNGNLFMIIENKEQRIKERFKICDFREERLWNGQNKCMVLTLKRI